MSTEYPQNPSRRSSVSAIVMSIKNIFSYFHSFNICTDRTKIIMSKLLMLVYESRQRAPNKLRAVIVFLSAWLTQDVGCAPRAGRLSCIQT